MLDQQRDRRKTCRLEALQCCTQPTKAVTWNCSLKLLKTHRKTPVLELVLIKLQAITQNITHRHSSAVVL